MSTSKETGHESIYHTAASVYAGLDVHKDSIDIAMAEAGRDGNVRHLGAVAGGVNAVSKALRRLVSQGHCVITLVAEIQDFHRFANPRH